MCIKRSIILACLLFTRHRFSACSLHNITNSVQSHLKMKENRKSLNISPNDRHIIHLFSWKFSNYTINNIRINKNKNSSVFRQVNWELITQNYRRRQQYIKYWLVAKPPPQSLKLQLIDEVIIAMCLKTELKQSKFLKLSDIKVYMKTSEDDCTIQKHIKQTKLTHTWVPLKVPVM